MGLLLKIIVPNIQKMRSGYERKQFISKLNALLSFTWQHAIVTQAIHRIQFDLEKNSVSVYFATKEHTAHGKPLFSPVKGRYINTRIPWPQQIKIKQFFVLGFDEMRRFVERTVSQVWFYVAPEGLAQEVIINFTDTSDTRQTLPRTTSLVLNPFTAQFTVYDTFQKP